MSRCVLLNFAHQECSPKSERAAFRILGVFGSPEEARVHASKLGTEATIHLLNLKTWTPIMIKEDAPEALSHMQQLGEEHRQRLQAHADEFAQNVSSRQTGSTTQTPKSVESHCTLETALASPVSPVPRDAEVRLQRFAVVSIISDLKQQNADQQQPCVLIWDAVDTEEEARAMIKNSIGHEVSDVHLDVVAMYEWLFPTAVDLSHVTEEYRDEKLNDIMSHRKDEHKRVADFKRLCEKQGKEVPVISLGGEEQQLQLPPSEPPMLPVSFVENSINNAE
jgi:hypothetical protein